MKRVAIVGCTGSVGGAAIDICRRYPEFFQVKGLIAHSSEKKLAELASEFSCPQSLCCLTSNNKSHLDDIVTSDDIDHVVFAASGTDTIGALQKSLSAGKEVSLANKESIVVGGAWVLPLLKSQDQLRPLDSEHNALWQCLRNERKDDVKCAYLTASGGAFRNFSAEELKNVTPQMALNHPVWNMGPKITIDSATLMNKGIEIIEAMLLFGLPHDKVEAVLSPGSFVHGFVEFIDGSVKLLAATPDMRLPALACLSYPNRLPLRINELFPVCKPRTLSFDTPDEKRFPCLRLAKIAAKQRGRTPILLVGADEVAVEAFIQGKLSFSGIADVIEHVMSALAGGEPGSLTEALEILEAAKTEAAIFIKER